MTTMDQVISARVNSQSFIHRYPRAVPLMVFLFTAAVTLLSVMAIERVEARRRAIRLERDAAEISAAIQRRATENIAYLRAGAALFSAQPGIDPVRFRKFVVDLRIDRKDAAALGMGWAPRIVTEADEASVMAAARSSNPNFRIWPASGEDRPRVPVMLLEPGTPQNLNAIGYDMYSEARRREAMDAAMRTALPVATAPVLLVQSRDKPGDAGFLVYAPVYGEGLPSSRNLRGFVYSPFAGSEFLRAAKSLYADRNFNVAIFDGDTDGGALLVRSENFVDLPEAIEMTMPIAGRQWTLRVSERDPATFSDASRAILLAGSLIALLLLYIVSLITARAAEDRQLLEWQQRQASIRASLTRELNHRVKNTLANVLSIIALTRRRATGLDDFAESLTGRVRALSATHDLLTRSDWGTTPIAEVIRSELAPYMHETDGHVAMDGPGIDLAPNDALSLGLAIHELATNAAKYGALSVPAGEVDIRWELDSPGIARIEWQERGGPPVIDHGKRGFGRDLIEKIVAHELKSPVELRFDPEGVRCTLRVPVRQSVEFSLRAPPVS